MNITIFCLVECIIVSDFQYAMFFKENELAFFFSQSAFMSYFIASFALSWTKKVLNFHSSFPGDRFNSFLLIFLNLWNYVFCMISCPSTLKFRYFNAFFFVIIPKRFIYTSKRNFLCFLQLFHSFFVERLLCNLKINF